MNIREIAELVEELSLRVTILEKKLAALENAAAQ